MPGYFGKRLVGAKLLPAPAALVVTVDSDVVGYLDGIQASSSNFLSIADARALWAVKVTGAEEGKGTISVGGTALSGTSLVSYVVSATVFKRLKAHRF